MRQLKVGKGMLLLATHRMTISWFARTKISLEGCRLKTGLTERTRGSKVRGEGREIEICETAVIQREGK